MEKDYSLLIAAMVGIVAITGMVLYFSSANTGATVARNSEQVRFVAYGKEVVGMYPGNIEHGDWCSSNCQMKCDHEHQLLECNDYCRAVCNSDLRRQIMIPA